MKRRFREDKSRHPFAWNPDYGWQLLRRSSSYREAVDEYVEAATKANDKMSLAAFDKMSMCFNKEKRRRVVRGKKEHRKQFLQNRDFEPLPLSEFPVGRRKYTEEDMRSRIKVPTNTRYYRSFLSWFGDLIRFPISYNTNLPFVDVLGSVWALEPLMTVAPDYVVPDGHYLADESGKVSYHTFAINENFDAKTVAQDAYDYVLEYMTGEPALKRKPRWDDKEFREYLTVIDLIGCINPITNIPFGYREIGKRAAPNSCRTVEAKTNWAKNKVKYVKTMLMPFFEREKPNQNKGLRGY